MTNQSSEVIHCPNCKEDVPKTLYCLNCGYPLYKLEKQKIEDSTEESVSNSLEKVDMSVEIRQSEIIEPVGEHEIEEKLESISELETEATPEVEVETQYKLVNEEKQELASESEIEVEPELEDLIPELESVIEETVTESEQEIETSIEVEYEEPESELIIEERELEQETEPIIEVEYEEPEAILEETKPESVEWIIEEVEETVSEPVLESVIENEIFTPEERESYMMDEVKIEFAPDPLTQEVMMNLAKNITLKIRLVRLLRESQVKEETFKKLFDSYVEQGRLWVGRRDEIIRRFKSDIERMEDELVTARKDFELLEIRKNIGDASENEYNVKAPAYKWDIENLDKEIKNTRGGIKYAINLQGLIPSEEVVELKAMAESGYSELDNLEGITSDTIARMKVSLAEALSSLEY